MPHATTLALAVLGGKTEMTTFINQSVSADSIRNDKFTFDDVDGYYVNATVGGISQNTITFGNGFEDSVTAAGTISNNKITFGDGGDDLVTDGTISNNTITFGDGVFDVVVANRDISGHRITFGNCSGWFDFVHAEINISKTTIIVGNGGD